MIGMIAIESILILIESNWIQLRLGREASFVGVKLAGQVRQAEG